jgi:hypothetical protein
MSENNEPAKISEGMQELLAQQERLTETENELHAAQHGLSNALFLLGQKTGMQLLADALGINLQDEEVQSKLMLVKEQVQPTDPMQAIAEMFEQAGLGSQFQAISAADFDPSRL